MERGTRMEVGREVGMEGWKEGGRGKLDTRNEERREGDSERH